MLHQPRFSTAIRRTSLVLLQVCLFGVLAVATPKEPSKIVGSLPSETTSTATAAETAAKDAAVTTQQPVAVPSPPQHVGVSPGKMQQGDQGQRYGEPGFIGEPINLNVVNADIRDILNYITEQYGINFVIDKSVSGVSVTVNVQDVPWNVALDAVLKANRLGVEVSGNILRVATTEVLAEESHIQKVLKDSRLDASPLVTEFIRLNYACGSAALCAAQNGDFKGGVTTIDNAYMTNAQGQPQAQSSTAGGGGIQPIVQKRLSRRGSVEVDETTNTLIITDVKENIDAIRHLVTLLDQPEPQVEIETRIVIANRSFSRDLGVQLNALALNTSTGGTAGYGTAQPSPLANSTGTGGATNTIGLRPSGIPQGILNPSGALGANLPNTVIGLTTGMIGTAQISALITAAETRGQVKIIATPRVTTLNNRKAEISSGQQIPVTTPQTGAGGTGGVLVFTTQFVSVPLRLAVTPRITDAGTVLLHVSAENNTVNTAIAINGTPGIDTQKMETYVLVPDGGTTIVGGVLGENENEVQNRTPGLGSIPVLGNLFKRKLVTKQSNEILFFITPRIYRSDYQGKPTTSVVGTGNRSVTIPQPVPLGNPQSNTTPAQQTPQQAPAPTPANPSPVLQRPGGDRQ